MKHLIRAVAGIWMAAVASAAVFADEPRDIVVTEDLTLEPGDLAARLVIAADHVTIDGQGATLVGPGEEGQPESFAGVGIQANGASHVTLRNINAKGFQTGLAIDDGRGW